MNVLSLSVFLPPCGRRSPVEQWCRDKLFSALVSLRIATGIASIAWVASFLLLSRHVAEALSLLSSGEK